jgi:hypothetical protein
MHHFPEFRTGRGGDRDSDLDSGDEFDPERSLGRLVGELGKVMHGVSVSLPLVIEEGTGL